MTPSVRAIAVLGVLLAGLALAAACQDKVPDAAPAPKPSSGTVSSNDKISDAGSDH